MWNTDCPSLGRAALAAALMMMIASWCPPAAAIAGLQEPGPATTVPAAAETKAAVIYQLDDASAEQAVGDQGQYIWINRFTPAPDDFPLEVRAVEVVIGEVATVLGAPLEVFVYQDTDGDGDPGTNAQLLATATGTVQANDRATPTTILIDPAPVLEGPGDLLIGVVYRAGAEGVADYPAAIDQTTSQGRSWVGSWLGGDVPANPTLPADEQWGTIDSFGIPGNWLLRASVETDIPDTRPPVLLANTGAALIEGASLVLDASMLQAADPDTDDDILQYALTSGPANGQLELLSAPGVAIVSFTQAQLNAGQVAYVHDDSESTSDSFAFDVRDGSGNDLTAQSFAIAVTPVDDMAPTLSANAGLTVAEGSSGTIGSAALQATDVDSDDAQLLFVVTSAPVNGQLELAGAPGVAVSSFTQAQVDANQVLYQHDGSETTADSVGLDVQDGSGNNLTGQVFALTITGVDDQPPTLVANTGVTVIEGGSASIGTAALQAADPDTDASLLLYAVTSAPVNGELELSGAPGTSIASFSQAQVDAGQVLYVHDGSNTSADAFAFDVHDGSGNDLTGQSFSITVTAVDDDTVLANPTTLSLVEGTGGSFTVALSTQPTGPVLIDVSSLQPTAATATPSQLTFSPDDWSVPQSVSVQTVEDAIAGGTRNATIQLAIAAGTTDATYAALPPTSVTVSVLDDDTAGIAVATGGTLQTTEGGGTDSFTIVLQSQPTADVTVFVQSSDSGEGLVSPAQLVFTTANWNVPQLVTATGVDDGNLDDDQAWTVTFAVASADVTYGGQTVPAVGAVNADDEVVPLAQPAVIPATSGWTLAALALLLMALASPAMLRLRQH